VASFIEAVSVGLRVGMWSKCDPIAYNGPGEPGILVQMHSDHADADALRSARRRVGARLLAGLALTAVVLLAHLALLQARPPQVAPRATPAAHKFSIRAVDAGPLAATAPPAVPETVAFGPPAPASGRPPAAGRTDARRAAGSAPVRTPAPRRTAELERKIAEVKAEPTQHAINQIANLRDDAADAASARPVSAAVANAHETPDPIAAAAPEHGAAQTAPPTAFRIAAPARLNYEVQGQIRGIAYQAQAELLWRHDAKHYDARLDIEVPLIGTRRQTSAGSIGAAGLAPPRFSDKARSELAAHFVRPEGGGPGHVVFSANTPQAPLEPGAQDRLSVFLQLGAMLAAAPERYPTGSTIALQIVGPRDADLWRFEVGASERLALPYGEVDATLLSRAPPREYDTRVDLWLAPSLGGLPVRILLTRPRGERLDLRLRALGSPD
jgi:hypothetical protein